MKTIRLFTEDTEEWTDLSREYFLEIRRVLAPIVEKAINNNHSLRDLNYIIDNTGEDICLDKLLNKSGK